MRKISKTTLFISCLSLALTFGQSQDKDTLVREKYHFSTKTYRDLDVSITYGIGSLKIMANKKKYDIDGKVEYNPSKMTPSVSFDSFGNTALLEVRIKSKNLDNDKDFHFSIDDLKINRKREQYENNMEFELPTATPTALNLDFGMGSAFLDLTKIKLTNLDIDCGLSDVEIVVNRRNRGRFDRLRLKSGLGDLNATGLGNLRARELKLEVGLGSAIIDLRGEDITDMEGEIEVGLGSLDLILPA
ncbi:MAG: hypothetical protein GXO92_07320, partial [FCB group bacterium]|nr:hypothetical protein [FCB group bacterium]